MVIMALDHAGSVFDRNHLVTDSSLLYEPGTPLPLAEFLTRWLTHLCAPTFLFLAGTSLSLSVHKQRERGVSSWVVDRHILARGFLIVILELTWVSLSWRIYGAGFHFTVQVLYAIGFSMILMVPLRRLNATALVAVAVGLILAREGIAGVWAEDGWNSPIAAALFFRLGAYGSSGVLVLYPVVPWLAMMILGWAFGRHLISCEASGRTPVRALLIAGALGISAFVVVRGANAYGNMGLLREDGSFVQWLHVSKYPPSLTFTAATLGVMALLLAGLFSGHRRWGGRVTRWNPLILFGQTALFFYLLHIPILASAGKALGLVHGSDLGGAYLVTGVLLVVLTPLCLLYRRAKARHPRGWTRYI